MSRKINWLHRNACSGRWFRSTERKSTPIKSIFLLFPLLLSSACSDGDAFRLPTPSLPSSNNDDTQGTNTVSNINGETTGYIWSSRSGYRFNIETGVSTRISKSGDIYPSRDGTEYIDHFSEVRSVDTDCITIFDDGDRIEFVDTKSGEVTSSFETDFRLFGGMHLSPDGQSIATDIYDLEVCDDSYFPNFAILSRQGEIIIQGPRYIYTADWLPDNRLAALVRLENGKFALVEERERHSLDFRIVAQLENIVGSPAYLRVSPDGNTVLFEGVTGRNQTFSGVKYRDGTVYRMNIDGSNLVRLIDTSRNGDKRVNQPVWSPDGTSLLVTENYTSGAAVTYYGTDDIAPVITDVGVVPVSFNSVTYFVNAGQGSMALPPAVYSELVKPVFTTRDGELQSAQFNPLYTLNWTPIVK